MSAPTRETRYLNALSALKQNAPKLSANRHRKAFVDLLFEHTLQFRKQPSPKMLTSTRRYMKQFGWA